MPESSGSDPSARSAVAPPLVTSKPVQRTGYAVLAASGLVLATAFGGIAELVSQPDSGATGRFASSSDAGSPNGGKGSPAQSDDGDRTRTIDGVAVAEALPGKSTRASRPRAGAPAPTTIVTIGPDGKPTRTTIIPRNPPERSGRDGGTGRSSTEDGGTRTGGDTSTSDGGDTSSSTPGGDSETSDPPSDSTTPTDTNEPTETETPTETTDPSPSETTDPSPSDTTDPSPSETTDPSGSGQDDPPSETGDTGTQSQAG